VSEDQQRPADIDIRRFVAQLAAHKWWLVACAVASTLTFGVVAFTMTPVYQATTVLVSAQHDQSALGSLGSSLGQLGGLASLAGINVGSGDSQAQESLAVLQSREFTEAFIRDNGLMQELFRSRWDTSAQQWRGAKDSWPSLAQASKLFSSKVRDVSRDRLTGLVTMHIEWRDPRTAALWANRLVERVNSEMRVRAISSTSASLGFLENELQRSSAVETRQAINRLIEGQINQRMLANVTQEYAFRVVDRALPPDPRDKVRPNKPLLLVFGFFIGIFLGVFLVLVKSMFGPRREVR